MLLEGFLVLIKHRFNVRTSAGRKTHSGFKILLFLITVENASPYLYICALTIMVIVGDNH